jgi:hypothetical protein
LTFVLSVLFFWPTRRKPPTCRKSLTTLSHNVVHLALMEIRTHNISGDRYWLHRYLLIQLPYEDYGHDGLWSVAILKCREKGENTIQKSCSIFSVLSSVL